jgi:hypothetical protein
MRQFLGIAIGLALSCVSGTSADDVVTAVEGTIQKVDAGARTIVVKTADGSEHTIHIVKNTAVHGAAGAAAGAEDAFQSLKEGSDVVAHVTKKGAEESAREIDHIGEGGMKATEGTISSVSRGAKTIAVKTADGAEETYRLSGQAAKETGKDIATGTGKSAKVIVYYTEEAGRKVAHFFKKIS